MKAIEKYLQHYIEGSSLATGQELCAQHSSWQNVLVIPLKAEGNLFLKALEHLRQQNFGPLLLVLVINASESDSLEIFKINQSLVGRLQKMGPTKFLSKNHSLIKLSEQMHTVVLNFSTPSCHFNLKQGVGLARKVGCDLAFFLQEMGRVRSPWICTTDADALLPFDYFSCQALVTQSASALCYPFEHFNSSLGKDAVALQLYDLSLRYYVRGLSYAGSKYAYHSVGSTLAIRHLAYAQVRGFPKRLAGEDFYILNKLAKLGEIKTPQCGVIQLLGRHSNRTPFGTGQAIQRILEQKKLGRSFLLYDPRSFSLLRSLHFAFEDFFINAELNRFQEIMESDPLLSRLNDQMEIDQKLEIFKRTTKSRMALRKQVLAWFDAWKCLKFIHLSRESGLPDIPWQEALNGLERLSKRKAAIPLESTVKLGYLQHERSL